MYMMAVGSWGIQPSEFKRMGLGEFFMLYGHYDDMNRKARGQLTRAEEAELRDWV